MLVSTKLMRRFRKSPVGRNLYNIWLFVFALIVFLIFVSTYLVQAQTINMPDWTKDLRKYDGEEWDRYASILIVVVCVLFTFTLVTGVAILRSGQY
ncbi:unnamed protein product [Fusarium graminearum]|uniref:Uncharacterized protein n=1 Tax=Gibberella zeae TaxID=5518 RepID=A0A4U9FBC9_GIBZA|nr:unnamed protein product [Fusarium graminearum]CAG1965356.1 unnamed protein product [Fusarium graminearum]CAG1970222.1 unnamed protein product [Fusarium graminearum]CAG1997112.1 unnamed protein product [Fusarium graminearum]CAG2008577.1 unnamed protein product [Fusarium graminearum]